MKIVRACEKWLVNFGKMLYLACYASQTEKTLNIQSIIRYAMVACSITKRRLFMNTYVFKGNSL